MQSPVPLGIFPAISLVWRASLRDNFDATGAFPSEQDRVVMLDQNLKLY